MQGLGIRGVGVQGFGVCIVRGFRVYGSGNLADEVCFTVMDAPLSWEGGEGEERGLKILKALQGMAVQFLQE